jgi:hypothetical protein
MPADAADAEDTRMDVAPYGMRPVIGNLASSQTMTGQHTRRMGHAVARRLAVCRRAARQPPG